MNIELLDSAKDNGRKVIPLHTGRVQIGIAYQPKPKQSDAQWIEKHRARRGVGKWFVWSVLGFLALVAISWRA